jgi:L-alanine-DL-glutamate epimerase-like enolase superfamily enzyme
MDREARLTRFPSRPSPCRKDRIMTQPAITATVERWPLASHFTLARGTQKHVDVVVVQARADGHVGRGEGTPLYYEGETAELCVEAIEMRAKARTPLTRDSLLDTMMEGAARNALDCALWDLEAKQAGSPVWQAAGLPQPQPFLTALTISIDEPAAMEAAARAAAGHKLLKIKLDGQGDLDRVRAVRRGAPDARLIVDANESWDDLDIGEAAEALAALGVEMIEQPVSAGEEDLLLDFKSPIPFCADESCHTAEDLDRCEGRFQVVNIKLDKAGGLTEALRLAEKARMRGLDIMVGSMLATSLGIAPAALLTARAKWVDLDGPLLLKKDRPGGFTADGGMMRNPGTALWG